eukprot:scaffold27062_cov44-Phaeocystis_antarctica.AAC.3
MERSCIALTPTGLRLVGAESDMYAAHNVLYMLSKASFDCARCDSSTVGRYALSRSNTRPTSSSDEVRSACPRGAGDRSLEGGGEAGEGE